MPVDLKLNDRTPYLATYIPPHLVLPVAAMARSDERVSTIVESHLPLCPRGCKHIANPSYGQKNWDTVGMLFEIVRHHWFPRMLLSHASIGQCLGGKDACGVTPLDDLVSDTARLDLLNELVALDPPPYRKEVFHAEAILMQANLREKVEAVSAASQPQVRVIRRAASFNPATPRRHRMQASVPATTSGRVGSGAGGGSVGRPTNPTCEVLVYIYTDVRALSLCAHCHEADCILECTGACRDRCSRNSTRQRRRVCF